MSLGVLFHGSPHSGLEVLRPHASAVIGGESAVFGTNSLWLALVFAAAPSGSMLEFGFLNGRPYIAELEPRTLTCLQKRGYIYTISAEGFRRDARLGMEHHEFINNSDVDVLECYECDNVLSDLRNRCSNVTLVYYGEQEKFLQDNN